MEKKLTAIDWLVEQLEQQIVSSKNPNCPTKRTGEYRIGLRRAIDLCDQAKEMEKQQIMEAVYDSMGTNFDPNMGRAEQYYNTKFKTN
jgi:hypothetical protein